MTRSKGERTGKEWDGLRSGRVGGGRGVRSGGGGGEMGRLEECEGWRRKRNRRGLQEAEEVGEEFYYLS